MELIYCYMGVIGGKELNLEFPFSDKYEVSYDRDSKSVDIKECDEKIPSNFYGKNISNLNLIVGINGSWKSTLLNLIGSQVYDRRKLFSIMINGLLSIITKRMSSFLKEVTCK